MDVYGSLNEKTSRTPESRPRAAGRAGVEEILQANTGEAGRLGWDRKPNRADGLAQPMGTGGLAGGTVQRETAGVRAGSGGVAQFQLTRNPAFPANVQGWMTAYNAAVAAGLAGGPAAALQANAQLLFQIWEWCRGLWGVQRWWYGDTAVQALEQELMQEFVNVPPAAHPNYGVDVMGDGSFVTDDRGRFLQKTSSDFTKLSGSATFRNLLSEVYLEKHAGGGVAKDISLRPGIVGPGMAYMEGGAGSYMIGGVSGGGAGQAISIDTAEGGEASWGGLRHIALAHEMVHALHGLKGVRLNGGTALPPGTLPAGTTNDMSGFLRANGQPYAGATPDDIPTMGNLEGIGRPNVEGMLNPFYTGLGLPGMELVNEDRIRQELHERRRRSYDP